MDQSTINNKVSTSTSSFHRPSNNNTSRDEACTQQQRHRRPHRSTQSVLHHVLRASSTTSATGTRRPPLIKRKRSLTDSPSTSLALDPPTGTSTGATEHEFPLAMSRTTEADTTAAANTCTEDQTNQEPPCKQVDQPRMLLPTELWPSRSLLIQEQRPQQQTQQGLQLQQPQSPSVDLPTPCLSLQQRPSRRRVVPLSNDDHNHNSLHTHPSPSASSWKNKTRRQRRIDLYRRTVKRDQEELQGTRGGHSHRNHPSSFSPDDDSLLLVLCLVWLLHLDRSYDSWNQQQRIEILQQKNEGLRQKLKEARGKLDVVSRRFSLYVSLHPFKQQPREQQQQQQTLPKAKSSPTAITRTSRSTSVLRPTPASTGLVHTNPGGPGGRIDQQILLSRHDREGEPRLPVTQHGRDQYVIQNTNADESSMRSRCNSNSRLDTDDTAKTSTMSASNGGGMDHRHRSTELKSTTRQPPARPKLVQQHATTTGEDVGHELPSHQLVSSCSGNADGDGASRLNSDSLDRDEADQPTLPPDESYPIPTRRTGDNANKTDHKGSNEASPPCHQEPSNLGTLPKTSAKGIMERNRHVPTTSTATATALDRSSEAQIATNDSMAFVNPNQGQEPAGLSSSDHHRRPLKDSTRGDSGPFHRSSHNREAKHSHRQEQAGSAQLALPQGRRRERDESRDIYLEAEKKPIPFDDEPSGEEEVVIPSTSRDPSRAQAPQSQCPSRATLDLHDPIDEEEDDGYDKHKEKRRRSGSLTFSKPAHGSAKRSPTTGLLHEQPPQQYKHQQETSRVSKSAGSDQEPKPQEHSISWVQHTHRYRGDNFEDCGGDDDRSMMVADPSQVSYFLPSQPSQFIGGREPQPDNIPSSLLTRTNPEVGNKIGQSHSAQGQPKRLNSQISYEYGHELSYQGNESVDEDAMEFSQDLLSLPRPPATTNTTAPWIASRKQTGTNSLGRGETSRLSRPSVQQDKKQAAVMNPNDPSPSSRNDSNKSFSTRPGQTEPWKASMPTSRQQYNANDDSQTIVPPPAGLRKFPPESSAPMSSASNQTTPKDSVMTSSFPQDDTDSQTVIPPSTRRDRDTADTEVFPDGPVVSATAISPRPQQQRQPSVGPRSLALSSRNPPTEAPFGARAKCEEKTQRNPLGLVTTEMNRASNSVPVPHHPRGPAATFITPSRRPPRAHVNSEGDNIGHKEMHHANPSEISGPKETALSRASARARRVTLGDGRTSSPANVASDDKEGGDSFLEADISEASGERSRKSQGQTKIVGGRNGVTHAGGGWLSNKAARKFVSKLTTQNQDRKQDNRLQDSSKLRSDTATSTMGKKQHSTKRTPERKDLDSPEAAMTPPSSPPANDPAVAAAAAPDRTCAFYRYTETVRSKHERQKLPPRICPHCDQFFDAIMGQGNASEIFDRHELVCQSRHRTRHTPPSTPEHFWDLSFRDEVIKRDGPPMS